MKMGTEQLVKLFQKKVVEDAQDRRKIGEGKTEEKIENKIKIGNKIPVIQPRDRRKHNSVREKIISGTTRKQEQRKNFDQHKQQENFDQHKQRENFDQHKQLGNLTPLVLLNFLKVEKKYQKKQNSNSTVWNHRN